MNRASFKECLEFGVKCEHYFIELMDFQCYAHAAGREPTWDICHYPIMEKADCIIYEVKADTRCHQTGNLAIEIASSGCKSGIRITEANTWIQFVFKDKYNTDYYYEIPVPVLRELIANDDTLRTVNSCEGGKNTCVLIPEWKVNAYRKVIPNEKRRPV